MNDELFQKLKELERYCKEDFLISLTNKGIYNRALKDFEKIKDIINIKFDDDNIKVSFEDVEVIFKNDEIKNSVYSVFTINYTITVTNIIHTYASSKILLMQKIHLFIID